MKYSDLEQLVDNMLSDIFKGKDLNTLSKDEQSHAIYEYLTNNIQFDYNLWEIKKARAFSLIPSPKQQVVDIFLKHKGYCSAIAQAYKLLLERLGITVAAVVGTDDGDDHQFNLVKRGEYWSFDDVTLGIIFPDKKDEYFNYDNLEEKKQVIIGILPDELYDSILGRVVNRGYSTLKTNPKTGLCDLPSNIKSTKDNNVNIGLAK